MIQFIAFILIVILTSMILFNRTAGIYKYIILAIFLSLFCVILFNSNFYLDLPMAGSITFIYFLFITGQTVIRRSYVCYIIILVIAASFALHLAGYTDFAQRFVNLAFYSILILITRLVLKLDTKT